MEITIEYSDKHERENILNTNSDKFLIAEKKIREGNFLVFTTVQPMSAEIEELKQEKMMIQLALAESIENQEVGKLSNQLALAELVETLIIKGVL